MEKEIGNHGLFKMITGRGREKTNARSSPDQ